MIKYYYGEDYAFEYAFLIHYQAWLQIPTIFGLIISIIQGWKYIQTGNIDKALDTPYNSLFGLFVTFWATCFVESWRRKQKIIQYLWTCEDSSFKMVDERTEEFKYYNYYNPAINQVEKIAQKMPKKLKRIYQLLTYLLLLIIISAMVIHRKMISDNKYTVDEKGNAEGDMTEEELAWRKNKEIIINTSFSIGVLFFGTLYKNLAVK